MMFVVINCLLNCQFLTPYSIQFFETSVYCTILNVLSPGCLVVSSASMKKEKRLNKLLALGVGYNEAQNTKV